LKVQLKIKLIHDGELLIEGASLQEIISALNEIGIDLNKLLYFEEKASIKNKMPNTSNLFELTDRGPVPIADLDNLSIREAILLTLYGAYLLQRKGMRAAQIIDILKERGLPSSTSSFYARIAELRKDGLILKEGDSWKVTRKGIDFIRDKVLLKLQTKYK